MTLTNTPSSMNYAQIATDLRATAEYLRPRQLLQKQGFFQFNANGNVVACCVLGAMSRVMPLENYLSRRRAHALMFLEKAVGRPTVAWSDSASSKEYVIAELHRVADEADRMVD